MKKIIIPVALVVVIALAVVSITKNDEQPVAEATPIVATADAPEATVAIQAVTDNVGLASVAGVRSKTVSWEARNFPANIGVDINLLRKVSDSPISYTLVRKIVSNTNHDGSEIWTPTASEIVNDLYLEVTCASGASFTGGCQTSSQPIQAN